MEGAQIFAQAHQNAILQNEQSSYHWKKYKDGIVCTKGLLQELPLKLTHQVLVPMGKKAFMPGKIVHSNEFMISIGAGYFTKATACEAGQYCDRRLQACEETLKNLETERELLVNRIKLPGEADAFGDPDRPEIIEHVTEEEHEKWKEDHKASETKYRQELSKVREKGKTKIETEEELWERLDQLELEEELEDELLRLHENDCSNDDHDGNDCSNDDHDGNDCSDDDDEDGTNSEVAEEVVHVTMDSQKKLQAEQIGTASPKRKRSVVFAETEKSEDTPALRLTFKHSDVPIVPATGISPSDIYPKYLEALKTTNPTPILKVKENPNAAKETRNVKLLVETSSSSEDEALESQLVQSGYVIPNVVQSTRGNDGPQMGQVPRRVSKFKASRLAARR